MRWLEWTLRGPRGMVGGVETHLLSMASCLEKRGVEVCYSSDPEVLFEGRDDRGHFDVVRTHGAALPRRHLFKVRATQAVRIHTLHGSSLGMMAGLREWHRYTHLKAFYREISGCLRADLVASVHGSLLLHRFSPVLGSPSVVIANGWDAGVPAEAGGVARDWRGRWAFIGRLWDRVKGPDRVLAALAADDSLELVAIPGEGLPDHERVLKTGFLAPTVIREQLRSSRGLLLPSRFEGLPLVVLEALAAGVPVLASRAGGTVRLEQQAVEGLYWLDDPDDAARFCSQIRRIEELEKGTDRAARGLRNQRRLWSWESCTQRLIEAVNPILLRKSGRRLPP
jgi:glycosyltransferase involved in cell wall biosynthesis